MEEQSKLSDRELEILELIVEGASNKEIAARLVISTNTVKVHLRNIYAKLGVNSRTEAALLAIQSELIRVESIAWKPSVVSMGHAESRSGLVPTLIVVGALLLTILGMLLWIRNSNDFPGTPGDGITIQEGMRWERKADLPTARSGLALTTYGNHFYAIGGATEAGISALAERYDPQLDSWTRLANKPIPVSEAQAGVIAGRIYIPGGKQASGKPIASLEAYDPSADRWEMRASLPVPLCGYSMVAFEGKLYLFGGWDGSDFVASVYRYDPGSDQWSELTPMPSARAFSAAVVASGVIYVLGGFDGRRSLPANEAYSPANDSAGREPWVVREFMPEGRHGLAATSLADTIYILGGKSQSNAGSYPLSYDPRQGTWQPFEDFSQGSDWQQGGLVAFGEHIYAMGGQAGGQPLSLNMSYQALYTLLLPALSK